MRSRFIIGTVLPLALVAACAGRRPEPAPSAAGGEFVESGFLTADYSRLAPVKPGSARRAYENPKTSFSSYDKLYINRITVWRDQDQTEPIESADFQKVVDALHAVATREIGKSFTLVDKPGPGVGRLRIALVAIDHPDDRLDVYVSRGDALLAESDAPVPTGLRQFGRSAWVEAEILDGVTNEPIFAVVDRVADVIPRTKPIESWLDLQLAFDAWAKQAAGRLAELKNRR
jgi:Protein of unknown function (DUF3313)